MLVHFFFGNPMTYFKSLFPFFLDIHNFMLFEGEKMTYGVKKEDWSDGKS